MTPGRVYFELRPSLYRGRQLLTAFFFDEALDFREQQTSPEADPGRSAAGARHHLLASVEIRERNLLASGVAAPSIGGVDDRLIRTSPYRAIAATTDVDESLTAMVAETLRQGE